MFINKETVALNFSAGLNSKTDAIQVQSPNLLKLTDAKFDKLGALNKRPGYEMLPHFVDNGSIINSAVAIDSFKNELNLFDNSSIYSYIPSNNTWTNRGVAVSLINKNKYIVNTSNAQQLNPDGIYLNGIEVYVWEDTRGGCRYSVIDSETSAYLISDKYIPGSSSKPRVIEFNNKIYIFYTSANNLYYRTISPSNSSIITPQINIAYDGLLNFRYDIVANDSQLYICYYSQNGTDVNLKYFTIDQNNNIATSVIIASNTDAIDSPYTVGSIDLTLDSDQKIWFSWSTGSKIYVTANSIGSTNDTIAVKLPTILVDSVVSSVLAGIEYIDNGNLELVYQIDNINHSNTQCKNVIIKYTGEIVPYGNLLSVGLASKPFRYGKDIFVQLAHQSNLQSTYFTVLLTNSPFTIVSKISPQLGGGLKTNGTVPKVRQLSDGIYLWANSIKKIFVSEGNTTFSLLGVNSTITDFTNINKFNSLTFSNNLLIVGGILQSYDGISVVEQNFHLFPEDLQATVFPTGGNLSVGQYQYQAVYSWTDNYGQIQYSSPSPALTVDILVPNSYVSLSIPTLRLTNKTNVIIKIYRTAVNGSIFNEITSELAPLNNSILIDSVIFNDVASDVSIQSNQIIYTTGGILENNSPPSCSMIALYNNRIFIGGLEDPNTLWYSKNKINNSNFNTIPVEFSQYLTISVNQLGGEITALGVMDQYLIIFKKNSIFVLSGDGPNDAGGGNQFPDPQLITNSVGCSNPNSVILTNQGIMFQTPDKGIWILDRSLGPPQYIGAGVDDEAKEYQISSATLDPHSNSVIFTTFNGPALVYDYLINQWATWSNHNAVDSIIFNNTLTLAKNDGRVYCQNQNIFYDEKPNNVKEHYPMEIITPWLSYSKILGYQSIFKIFLIGQYRGAHSLNVDIGYDFDPSFLNTVSIPVSNIAGINLWGSDALWGDSTPWGGSWNPYILQVNLQRQKCTSLRIRITDSPATVINEGYTANSLLLEIGGMPNGVRLPLNHKYGIQPK